MSKHSHRMAARRRSAPKPQTEIGRLARELATLTRQHFDLDDTPKSGGESVLPERVSDLLWDKAETLQDYISYLEPVSLEDVSALVIILADAVDLYISNYTDPRLHDIDPAQQHLWLGEAPDGREKREHGQLDRRIDVLLKNIQRGLLRLAPSPLAEESFPEFMRGSLAQDIKQAFAERKAKAAEEAKVKDAA